MSEPKLISPLLDGFSIGTKEDFVAFLKNKGIKVRRK